MSTDRPVHTDALQTLGTIIDDKQGRDAIHIAVEPVIAGDDLRPGQHVGFRSDGTVGLADEHVGIVDPFITQTVSKGERFWMLVYPRTITSLRHVWEHPAFPSAVTTIVSKAASERWMRAWAMEHVSEDYYGDGDKVDEDSAYAFAIRAGHEHFIGPYEDARDHMKDEWWSHWEIITGQKGDRDAYFRCGC